MLTPLRLLAAHWPALVAFYLGGILARYLVIELAAQVGARSAVGGTLVLCLAVLVRLISFVGMFLVVRDGLVRLGALAPIPEDRATRRRAFVDALLGGLLPFTAFYAAWGYLRDDNAAYLSRALEVQTELRWIALADGEEISLGQVDLSVEPMAVTLGVVAFLLRWLWKRYRDHAPRWLTPVAVYLETVWLFIAAIVIADTLSRITGWVDSRIAMVWLDGVYAWVGAQLAPIAWIWHGVLWFVGEVGGILLEPVAWLVIAGVIYGQAVSAQAPELTGSLVERVRARYGRVPAAVRRRLGDLWSDVAGRFTPIWKAIVLMWRAGPLLIAGYALAFTVLAALQIVLAWTVSRIVGPHDLDTFWRIASPAIGVITLVIIEPIRIALVAAAYDATLARLTATTSEIQRDPGETGEPLQGSDAEMQAVDGVDGDHERRDDLIGRVEDRRASIEDVGSGPAQPV